MSKMRISAYHHSYLNSIFNLLLLVPICIFCIPLGLAISIVLLITSGLPIIFKQKRIGKGGKAFVMYKFRTMKKGADEEKKNLMKMNEADGPVFKIQSDPRFTPFGKLLSKTGLDELPQFYNILIRDMNLVGPRPLPVLEARKLSKTYKIREKILPGIISSWVVEGMHNLKFRQWMALDKEYVLNAGLTTDIVIIVRYLISFFKLFYIVLTK